MTNKEQAIKIFRSYVQTQVNRGEARVAAFAEKVTVTPLYELEWADSVVEAAAELTVGKEVLGMVDGGATLEAITVHCEKTALQGARYPRNSTNPMQALVFRARVAAFAEMAVRAREFDTVD